MLNRIMNKWTNIGPEWKTEDIFRIREILKDEHIPFRMPFADVFFANTFNMPAADRRWGILVREKDWEKTVAVLVREGLACDNLCRDAASASCRAEAADLHTGFASPVPAMPRVLKQH